MVNTKQILQKKEGTIVIDGESQLNIGSLVSTSREFLSIEYKPTEKTAARANSILAAINNQIEQGVAIYGVTGSYGGQAARVLTKGETSERLENAKRLSKSIIHVDVSTGTPISDDIVRAAMIIRLNMLAPGYSGIRVTSLELLAKLINSGLTPIVGQYGSVGASGDLAQNGRIISALLQHETVSVRDRSGRIIPIKEACANNGISPIDLDPKEGLAIANGDNFSNAAAAIYLYDTVRLFFINIAAAALTAETLHAKTRSYHPMLAQIRRHPGQIYVTNLLWQSLQGSRMAQQDMVEHVHNEGESTQDPYSIRCLPQYYGPTWERLMQAWETVTINMNGVSDNPIWTSPEHIMPGEEPYKWISGGNFLAMHMADTLDTLRKSLTLIVKQCDRHLARLVNPIFSRGLPANLSSSESISQCVFKGLQTQMGMWEVYATVMANPVNTAFGVHEEHNQDLTSQAPASAIMTREVLNVARLAVATNLISLAQAVDLRGHSDQLSSITKKLYQWVRKEVPFINEEQPLGHYVEKLANKIDSDEILWRQIAEINSQI